MKYEQAGWFDAAHTWRLWQALTGRRGDTPPGLLAGEIEVLRGGPAAAWSSSRQLYRDLSASRPGILAEMSQQANPSEPA